MENAKQKEVRINIRVTEDLKERFHSYCHDNSLNASAVIRNLLEKWLQENDTKQ